MADLEYTIADGIGTILLNRPHRKNAFTLEMIDEWAGILTGARTDPDVRVIVLTGAGDAFCSGVDLSSHSSRDGERPSPLERKEHLTSHIHRIPYALEDLDKPVIAAINGVAVGANHVVDDDDLPAAVHTLARKLADAPPVAVRTIKRAVYQSARADLRTALDLISSHMAVVTSTQDSAEALAAFREKRPGHYVGR